MSTIGEDLNVFFKKNCLKKVDGKVLLEISWIRSTLNLTLTIIGLTLSSLMAYMIKKNILIKFKN